MKKEVLYVILIVVLGLVVYVNSLNGEFLWDDGNLVENNTYIRSPSYIPHIFSGNIRAGAGREGSFWRPLQTLSYMFDYSFWKLDVRGYHLTNTILHILAAVSVFSLISLLFKDRLLAFMSGLLFAVHPVHTEAVAYISGRADPLAGLFILLCLIFYIKWTDSPKIHLYLISLLSFGLALLSREASLILVLFLFVYHRVFKKKVSLKYFLGFIGLSLGHILVRLVFLRDVLTEPAVSESSLFQRLPGIFAALTDYVRLLILPFDLHMEYGERLFAWTYLKAIIGSLGIVVLLLYLLLKKRKNTLFLFGLGCFFVFLAPHSNLYPLNAYMAEHWLYLPSIGFCLIVAGLVRSLFGNKHLKAVAAVAFFCLVGFYSYLTIQQNAYWRRPTDFYLRTLKYAPDSFRVYNNLGNEHRKNKEYGQAVFAFMEAMEIDPQEANLYYNLGNVYRDMKEYSEAVSNYKKAIELEPGYVQAYDNLGVIYAAYGRNDQAVQAFKKAIELAPSYAQAHYNLAHTYQTTGKTLKASEAYTKVIALDPAHACAYNNLGVIYASQGKLDRAEELFKDAMLSDPEYPEAYNNLGNIYRSRGDNLKALAMYNKAVELRPDYADAHNNLALAYYAEGKFDLAVKHCNRALALGYTVSIDFLDMIRPHRR